MNTETVMALVGQIVRLTNARCTPLEGAAVIGILIGLATEQARQVGGQEYVDKVLEWIERAAVSTETQFHKTPELLN